MRVDNAPRAVDTNAFKQRGREITRTLNRSWVLDSVFLLIQDKELMDFL